MIAQKHEGEENREQLPANSGRISSLCASCAQNKRKPGFEQNHAALELKPEFKKTELKPASFCFSTHRSVQEQLSLNPESHPVISDENNKTDH